MLDVPVTIETGDLTKKNHFYDPKSRFDYPSATYDYDALVTASEIGGDCQKIMNKDDGESYKSCGHAILEIWSGFEEEVWSGFDESVQNALEPASTIGVVGEEKWFVPKYTAERDPTLLSYLGLQGLENRKKLADRFLRPTTWADYCNEVSEDGCLSGDGAAQRPPESEDEEGKYFSRGLYTGHFRKVCNRNDDGAHAYFSSFDFVYWDYANDIASNFFPLLFSQTQDNNCTASPTTCTGHYIDYPCGWKRWFLQQAHHLDIGLKSNGMEGSGGYTYSQMMQIWYAANWTQSDVIGLWYRPENLYQQFLGTPFEFHEVNLPNPHSKCVENRIGVDAWCGVDAEMQDPFGPPEGTCDFPPVSLIKVVSKGLHKLVYDSSIPEAKRSPAFDVLNRFTIDTFELEKIFANWQSSPTVDQYGYDVRNAVCEW